MKYNTLLAIGCALTFGLLTSAHAADKTKTSEVPMNETVANDQLSAEKNKALVREWFRLYEVKEIDKHNAMIHPEARTSYPEMQYMNPENSKGADFLKKTLKSDESAFVDLHMRIDNIWALGNTVFVEGFFIGSKLTGVLGKMAKATNNKVPYLHHIEVEDGKIKLVKSYYDTALFYQVQLGLQGPTMEEPIAPWMKALAAEAAKHSAKP